MKSFAVIIWPTLDGNGYIARWGKYQTWGLTRAEVIDDILKRISLSYKIK